MRRLIVTVVSIVLLLPASAVAATYDDPDDTWGPLDIERVAFLHFGYPARLRFTMFTYEDWTARRCQRAAELEDGCSILFWLDTRGEPAHRPTGRGVDHWVSWRTTGCVVLDLETRNEVVNGRAVKRNGSVTCVIRRSALDIRKKIRWFASTTWASPRDGSYATDYAPDAGWYG